jgi:hypothetical protein
MPSLKSFIDSEEYRCTCAAFQQAIDEEKEAIATWIENELKGEYSNFGLPNSIRSGEHHEPT